MTAKITNPAYAVEMLKQGKPVILAEKNGECEFFATVNEAELRVVELHLNGYRFKYRIVEFSLKKDQ